MKQEELVEALSQLTVLEMAELKTALEDKWGVKAAAAPVMAAMPMQAAPEAAAESTDFEVTLVSTPTRNGVYQNLREIRCPV